MTTVLYLSTLKAASVHYRCYQKENQTHPKSEIQNALKTATREEPLVGSEAVKTSNSHGAFGKNLRD